MRLLDIHDNFTNKESFSTFAATRYLANNEGVVVGPQITQHPLWERLSRDRRAAVSAFGVARLQSDINRKSDGINEPEKDPDKEEIAQVQRHLAIIRTGELVSFPLSNAALY